MNYRGQWWNEFREVLGDQADGMSNTAVYGILQYIGGNSKNPDKLRSSGYDEALQRPALMKMAARVYERSGTEVMR